MAARVLIRDPARPRYRHGLRPCAGLSDRVSRDPALHCHARRHVLCQGHDDHRQRRRSSTWKTKPSRHSRRHASIVPGMGSVNKLGAYVPAYVEIGVVIALLVVSDSVLWCFAGRSSAAASMPSAATATAPTCLAINVKRTKVPRPSALRHSRGHRRLCLLSCTSAPARRHMPAARR